MLCSYVYATVVPFDFGRFVVFALWPEMECIIHSCWLSLVMMLPDPFYVFLFCLWFVRV